MTPKQIADDIRKQALGRCAPMFYRLKVDSLNYVWPFFEEGQALVNVAEDEKRMFLLFVAETLR